MRPRLPRLDGDRAGRRYLDAVRRLGIAESPAAFVAIATIVSKCYNRYMPSIDPHQYDIAERPDRVEVRGVSRHQVAAALRLLDEVRVLQADHVAATRADLLRALMVQNVSLTPPATLAQAQRLATHRDALLATPVLTHELLRRLRGDKSESSTRTWLSRRRDARQLFTVTHNGKTLIPAFQLDDLGEPRAELQPILSTLIDAGVQGWPLWTWLTTATSFLSGAVPEQLARTAPRRVLRAAKRFAARPAA
jgi:hypothetical protein